MSKLSLTGRTLEDYHYEDRDIGQLIFDSMAEQKFVGISVRPVSDSSWQKKKKIVINSWELLTWLLIIQNESCAPPPIPLPNQCRWRES